MSLSETPAPPTGEGLSDPGAVHNTLLQLISQVAGAVFTTGLTLYLVRALGASGYGVYALAVSIGALLLYPAGLGLPWSVGRYLADHRADLDQVRAILRLGLRLQVPAALAISVALFAASGAIAGAYGYPQLAWPLRWVAVSVFGQAMFGFLSSAVTSVRRVSVSLWMSVIESATETSTSIALVLAGAGAAGATLGKAVGYGVAAAAGLFLTMRLLGGRSRRRNAPAAIGVRTVLRYAGAMFIVDVTWSAISQVDVLLIGALLTEEAVGSFSAVMRILTVLGYLGIAVSAGVAPRLSLAGGAPDTRAFSQGLRFLIVTQGLVIAPMIVWAQPIVSLLLGPGYESADQVMRALSLYCFIGAPAALLTVSVTYLGEARRRVIIMIGTLLFGVLATYVLLRTIGLVGAAIGDDLVEIVYVAANLWLCSQLITLDLRRLGWSLVRTLIAAGVMGLVLLVVGTDHLTAVQWVVGACAGGLAYAAVLLATRELSVAELRLVTTRVVRALRPTRATR